MALIEHYALTPSPDMIPSSKDFNKYWCKIFPFPLSGYESGKVGREAFEEIMNGPEKPINICCCNDTDADFLNQREQHLTTFAEALKIDSLYTKDYTYGDSTDSDILEEMTKSLSYVLFEVVREGTSFLKQKPPKKTNKKWMA